MSGGSREPYRIDHVKAVRQLDKSLLVLVAGKKVVIPQSLIDADSEVWREGDQGTLVIPEWLAIDRGID